MLFRRYVVGVLALAAAAPAPAHGPRQSGGKPGTASLEFACNIPRHYEDGMKGPVRFVKWGRP